MKTDAAPTTHAPGADAERAAFEAWAKARGYQRDELARSKLPLVSGEYHNAHTESHWQVWQAARLAQPAPDAQAATPSVSSTAGDDWPKLEKPATVGGGTFGVGVSSRHVVEAAQRHHERTAEDRTKTPEQRQQDEANRRALWDMMNGAPAPSQPQAATTPQAQGEEAAAQRASHTKQHLMRIARQVGRLDWDDRLVIGQAIGYIDAVIASAKDKP